MRRMWAAIMLLLTACTGPPPTPTPTPSPSPSPSPAPSPSPVPPTTPDRAYVLVGAGDVAACDSTGDEATADLLERIPGTVFTTGDNAYDGGSAADFAECYGPSWGRHKDRTRPAPGNHEYVTAGAGGYFDYFGPAAGEPGRGYYSYGLGPWHIVVVNSNCAAVGGCGRGSPQLRWLRDDLAGSAAECTLAYWHHPLFTSGAVHEGEVAMRPVFRALYEAGAEVVLTGHNHQYERFAPQDPDGNLDRVRGIREFVVGTGGRSHYEFGAIQPNSEVRGTGTFGVLELTLHSGEYDWRFVPVDGQSLTDSGTGTCH